MKLKNDYLNNEFPIFPYALTKLPCLGVFNGIKIVKSHRKKISLKLVHFELLEDYLLINNQFIKPLGPTQSAKNETQEIF